MFERVFICVRKCRADDWLLYSSVGGGRGGGAGTGRLANQIAEDED